MKKFLCILFACSLVSVAMADDGETSYPEDWTYGNIYVKEPNKNIALEKEYMYVARHEIDAVFSFRNTTNSTVVVPCAFPVVVRLPFHFENDSIVLGYSPQTYINETMWKIALDNKADIVVREYYWRLEMTTGELEKYDKKLRVMTYSDYQMMYKSDASCDIVQDEQPVALQNVGIETNVRILKSFGKGEGYGEVELVLHFFHELKFLPNALSKVCVGYGVDSYNGSYHGNIEEDYYGFDYDISTGATWKDGVIGSFVMLTEYSVDDIEGLNKTSVMSYDIWSARKYKPVGRFRFSMVLSHSWNRSFPSGSSHIALQRKSVGDNTVRYYTSEVNDASFNPILIDGEIGFKITDPCVGPFVANGIVDTQLSKKNGKLFNSLDSYEPELPTFQQDSVWQRYSRIKTAILTNEEEGLSDTLQLKDRFPAYPYDVSSTLFNDGWFGANTISNVRLLRPGEYKFSVSDIYKGDSTESVGVSHVWFYPVDKTLVSIIDEDKNSTMPLFSDVWKRVLVISIDDEKLKLGNVDFETIAQEELEAAAQKEKDKDSESKIDADDTHNNAVSGSANNDKVNADKSNSAVWFVVAALIALSGVAVFIVVRKRKSRSN